MKFYRAYDRLRPTPAVFLILLPALLLCVGYWYRRATGLYFAGTVDPEYAYLLNGLLLAGLHPDVPFVYHPGTPMICLTAIVMRVVHLFRPGPGLVADVMANPELYIRATVITANWIAAVAIALLGWVAYRRTKRILQAVMLQALPFVHTLSLEPLSRLIPEALMTAMVSLWIIWLLCLVIPSGNERQGKRNYLVFGFLYGLSVAVKLTFIPYIFIPLLALRRWRDRFRFAGVSLVTFIVFAFPVLFRHTYFVNWVKGILTHTGKYGSGDRGVINPAEFAEHLQLLMNHNRVLLIASVLLAAVLLVFRIRNRTMSAAMQFRYRLGIAFLLTVALQFMMAAKQFSYHYMLPAILLTYPVILLAGSLVAGRTKILYRLTSTLYIVALLVISLHLVPMVREQLSHMQQVNRQRTEAYHRYMALRTDAPTIVVCSYYGCSAVEYALTFGLHESGKYGDLLTTRMKERYPGTTLYFPWSGTFYDGKQEIKPSAFVTPGEYNLLVAGWSEEITTKVTAALATDPSLLNLERIYADSVVFEALFRLQVLPSGQ